MLSNVHGIVLWFRLQLIFYYFEPAFHKVIPEVVAQSLYNPAYDMQMRIAVVYAADTIDGCFVVHAVRLYRHHKGDRHLIRRYARISRARFPLTRLPVAFPHDSQKSPLG